MSSSLARIEPGNPLEALDPRQRMAVELYTNPLYRRTFGKKMASATAAGYEGKNCYKMFDGVAVQDALRYLDRLRAEDANRVSEYLEKHAMDAAHALVQQLGLDQDLTPKEMPEDALDKEPTPILGTNKDGDEYLIGWNDGHLQLAKTIVQHNKSIASLAKEKREAIKLVLAYAMGTPDQHKDAQRGGVRQGIDLSDLSDTELRNLMNQVQEVRAEKRGEEAPEPEGPPVLDADWEEDEGEDD